MTPPLKFVLLNAVLFSASWAAARGIFGFRGGGDRVLAAFVAGAAAVVILFQALGAFGGIGYGNALLFHSAVLAVVLIASFVLASRRRGEGGEETAPASESGASLLLMPACFRAVFIINAAFALTAPPAATDAFLDHLVFPAEWLKAGRITLVQTLSPEQATTYYPSNGELLYLWLMLPLRDDLATGLLEPLCLAMAALACARAGRRLGMGASWAAGGAALGALAPGVMVLSRMSGVDLFFAACFVTSVAFLLPDGEGRVSASEAVVAGLAAGLAVGAKYVGLAFAVMLPPLLFAGGRGGGSRAHRAALFFASAAAAGAYWYVRNMAATGSAFFPLGLKIAGVAIMPGAYDRAAMFNSYLHIPTSDLAYLGGLFSEHIYGWPLLAGMAAAFAFGVWKVIGKAGKEAAHGQKILESLLPRKEWWKRYVLGLGVYCVMLFWFVTPYNTANNYRFMAPAAFFFGLLVADVLSRAGARWVWWPLAVCAVAANWKGVGQVAGFVRAGLGELGQGGWYAGGLQVFGAAALTALAACFSAIFLPRGKRAAALAAGLLLAVFFAAFIPLKAGYMEGGRYRWYAGHYLGSGWAAVGGLKAPATIAYAGNCAPYGLYGNGLKNKVLYVNTDGSDFIFHDYVRELRKGGGKMPDRAVWLDPVYRSRRDFGKWRGALLRKNVDFLFVSKQLFMGRVEMPVEGEWAMGHPALFPPVFHQGDVWIFWVKKD